MKLLDEFLPELTAPVAAIYREAIASHTWPEPFKKEYHLPINKVPLPKSEDDLRNLGHGNTVLCLLLTHQGQIVGM